MQAIPGCPQPVTLHQDKVIYIQGAHSGRIITIDVTREENGARTEIIAGDTCARMQTIRLNVMPHNTLHHWIRYKAQVTIP